MKLSHCKCLIHDCRIANSAGRSRPPARRRLQPTSYIKAKLPLCTGLQSRKAVSIIKEHQVTVLIFSGRDFFARRNRACKAGSLLLFPTQAGACAERGWRRRLETAPSGGAVFRLRRTGEKICYEVSATRFLIKSETLRPAEFAIRQSWI
jgi:hypothetical protein